MRHARRIDAAGGQVPRNPHIALRRADRPLEILRQPAQPAPLFAQIARLDERVPGRHDVRHRGAGRRPRPAVAAVGGFRPQRQRVSPVVGHLRPGAGPRARTAPRPAKPDRCACACGPRLRRSRPNRRRHFGSTLPDRRRHFGSTLPNWLRPGRVRPSARSPQVLSGPAVATKSPRGAARSAETTCGRAACRCARSAARAAGLRPVESACRTPCARTSCLAPRSGPGAAYTAGCTGRPTTSPSLPLGRSRVNPAGCVNAPQSEAELAAIRRSVERGSPYGSGPWNERTIRRLG